MRPHLTHTFHGKAQQKERLTWAGAAQQAEVSAGAGGPYLVFCKRSRDHRGQLRTRTGSAQRWSNPTRTPPCGQTGHAASTPQHPQSWGWGGALGSVGSQEQEAWSGDWRPDWEPEAALCSLLVGLLFPRGGGAPQTCLSLPPGLTRFLLSYFLHPSAPPFKYRAPHASLLKIFFLPD